MMFGFTKKRPTLFYKYVLSYLLIFLIPFTTISIIFYHISISNLREDIISSNVAKLQQVMELSDSKMKELRDIATKISYDHRLTPYALQEPYSNKIGVEELTTYQMDNAFIDSLFLVYHEEAYVYSPKGTGTLDNVMNNIYPFKEGEKQQFKNILKTLKTPDVRSIMLDTMYEHNLITYLFPIHIDSNKSHGAVVFIVQEATIRNLMANILNDANENAYIFDGNNLILSKNTDDSLNVEQLKDITSNESSVFNEKIADESYTFVTVQSEQTGWTFMTSMPSTQFYEKVSSMKVTILMMLFIIALLGIGVTIYLSLKQYQPIRKLSQFLKQKSNENNKVEFMKENEFEEIKQTIEFMYKDSENLREKIDKQQPFVREQFLLELIKDNFKLRPKIDVLLKELQITFTGDYFFVTIIAFNEKISAETIEHREEILKLLSEVSYKTCKGFGTELFQENAVVLIVSTDSDLESTRNEFAVKLQDYLNGFFQVTPLIGVGKVYQGMNLVNRSFIEAAATIEHNRFNDKRELVYFEDITDQKRNPLWYPIESHVQFTQGLKRGDPMVTNEALKSIMADLKEKNITAHMLNCLCFDVINTVLKVISNLSLSINLDDIHAITEFTTLDDLQKKIETMVGIICDHVNKRVENHNNHLRDRLLHYIEQNFMRHDISLAIVAEEFELSISYVSRFIKEQTGSTFTEYIWTLRNDLFKQKLIESDLPIKEIVAQIGYVDVANFTRKFKKKEGLTPGQYRKSYDNIEQKKAL